MFKQAPIYLGVGGDSAKLDQILGNYETVYYREGNQSVVTVVDRPTLQTAPHRMLSIDGKVDDWETWAAAMAPMVISNTAWKLLGEGGLTLFDPNNKMTPYSYEGYRARKAGPTRRMELQRIRTSRYI